MAFKFHRLIAYGGVFFLLPVLIQCNPYPGDVPRDAELNPEENVYYQIEDGIYSSWYPHGSLFERGPCEPSAERPPCVRDIPSDAQENGSRWRIYHENGLIQAEGVYRDNLRVGEWIGYHHTGFDNVQYRGTYANRIPWTGDLPLPSGESTVSGVWHGTWTFYYDDFDENLPESQLIKRQAVYNLGTLDPETLFCYDRNQETIPCE